MRREGPLLSAAMIVRDEEAHLAACLASIRDIVDELVVVDTGSVDRTAEIARASGARLFHLGWQDDFAGARNHALDRARGAWILYIDADERLRPVDRRHVEAILSDAGKAAYALRFHPMTGFTAYWERRLFRKDSRLRFEGVIHERIPAAAWRALEAEGKAIGRAALTLDHVGYDGEQRAKHRRNLPLLRRQLARDPGRVYLWHHLGRVLAALGDEAGAAEAWEHGIEAARTRSPPAADAVLPYLELIAWRYRRGEPVDALLDEARSLFPGNLMLLWIEGRKLMDERRYGEAVPLFERLAAIDPEQFVDEASAYDKRIFGPLAHASLGAACFHLGRYADSAAWFARAEAAEPAVRQHALRRRLAELKAGGRAAGAAAR